jgi:3-isopropylmalate/(R)-2-methylmalate dehydratase small subunit
MTMRGRVWKFAGVLDVDWEICSYLLVRQLQENGPVTDEALAPHCLVNVDPDFPKKVKHGDFVVAGPNMGYGHDHDHASMALKGVGVGAVLCESSAPYFLRNSIDHGLPVIEIPNIMSLVDQGDELSIDLRAGRLENLTKKGEPLAFSPLPAFLLEVLEAGGIYPLLKPKYSQNAGRQ